MTDGTSREAPDTTFRIISASWAKLGYNSFGFNGTTLGNLGYPGGGVNVFSATVDPIVHLTPHSHFDLYAIGGGGLYHWYENFSAPRGRGHNPFAGGSFPIVDSEFGR